MESSSEPRPATLDEWLARCERLHSRTIELGLDRVRSVAERLDIAFSVPLVIVAGTNGKGSTCAMLESIAVQAGYRVGLYSKPHLVRFEERCRIDGRPVDSAELLPHFEAVEQARRDVPLTYFEFTTLVIARLLAAAPLDFVILEVGLGGRLDAVNIFDADCAVVTSIDIDHTAFLGNDREAIGFEKAGIMRPGRPAVVSDPLPPNSVVEHAERIGADLRLIGRDFGYSGDKQQWNWSGRSMRYSGLAYPALRGVNQLLNASGALAAFEALRQRVPVSAQAIRSGLATVALTGRFQIVPGQPTLVLDVAHNPHSVAALAQNLDQMGYYPATRAVFGAMADKNLDAIFSTMAPLVDSWHLTDLPVPRAARADELAARLNRVSRPAGHLLPTLHRTPAEALQAAASESDPVDRIVVFGSFYTVGGVIANGVPHFGSGALPDSR